MRARRKKQKNKTNAINRKFDFCLLVDSFKVLFRGESQKMTEEDKTKNKSPTRLQNLSKNLPNCSLEDDLTAFTADIFTASCCWQIVVLQKMQEKK
jgi:hypothetical protein